MPTIIVLDNDEDTRNFITDLLTKQGYQVYNPSRASDAIDQCHLIQPDLLVTEWKLQDEYDGFEVGDAFRFAKSDVKTIMMSDVESIADEPGHEYVFRYFQKPIPAEEFLQVVEAALVR